VPRVKKSKYFKKDKIIVKNNITGRIRKLIFPPEVDFGLKDYPEFAEKVRFYNGLSGSLQKLTDGTDYLVAGGGITISNNDNGSITIAASGGSGTGDIQGVTAGTGLSGGGTTGTAKLRHRRTFNKLK
jgi:hypothetical protein